MTRPTGSQRWGLFKARTCRTAAGCLSSHERPNPLSVGMPRFDCILRGNFTAQTKPRFQDKAGLLSGCAPCSRGAWGALDARLTKRQEDTYCC